MAGEARLVAVDGGIVSDLAERGVALAPEHAGRAV